MDNEEDFSFVLEMENGHEAMSFRSHLHHNVTRKPPITEKRVNFSLPDDANNEDKEKKKTPTKEDGGPVKRKRGRPRKEDTKVEVATSDATDPRISTRTRSKERLYLSVSATPLARSCLKPRETSH